MADEIIENPTYMEHIRHFFEEIDLEHMAAQGVDLSTYPLLTARANDVYLHTLQPDGDMPPEADRKWSAERSASFLNWITNGLPIGVPMPSPVQPGNAPRIRKDARDLSAEEIDTLTRAFRGIIDRDANDATSYFALAGMHWYPPPTECKHHNDLYQPWHRVFVTRFEDALRTVGGCANVTLPYWDITAPPPDFLFDPPFDSYTSPLEILPPDYPAGYQTVRFDAKTITANVEMFDIPNMIADAMKKFRWNEFNIGIWQAHDAGHPACGETMSVPDAASFDPIFWFFHANWDRLWWEWQQTMQATTFWTYRSTIFGSTAFLKAPLNTLAPFVGKTSDQTIDLSAMEIAYASPATEAASVDVEPVGFGSLVATKNVQVRPDSLVSVRLKGIDRLSIPGTFRVILKADEEPLAQRIFFQSTEPRTCDACRELPIIDLDFLVAADRVNGSALTADVELLTRADPRVGVRVPMRVCGNPTINVRMLLQERQ
jgi:tyrosinase